MYLPDYHSKSLLPNRREQRYQTTTNTPAGSDILLLDAAPKEINPLCVPYVYSQSTRSTWKNFSGSQASPPEKVATHGATTAFLLHHFFSHMLSH